MDNSALVAAAQIVEELPAGTTYAVTVTDEDSWDEPSALNIYLRSPADRAKIKRLLRLPERPDESGESFDSYRVGPIMVSLEDPEEEDDGS
jgi:hypothetical protein